MDEIGDEFNDTSGNDKTVEELPELTNESEELNEIDDDIPEVFSEPDEFDDIIPEVFSEPEEFDDDIPEIFSEPEEFDDDIPEIFSETDEIDDILDGAIQNKEHGERTDEDQDSGDVGNVIENENIGSQSTSTILTSKIEEIEEHMEHQEQEEEIEIRPEEYKDDTEPIVNTEEIEFIKDIEELAEHAREIKAEDEIVEPKAEQENAAYYAEQYYEKLKEKVVVKDQDSIEEQETEELRQEVTEEFEYLWEIRDILDREGKSPEEIEEVMHEAEEMYETLKNAEKLYEEQELEKLKLVDHEDEASVEDLKEDLDRVDLVEQAVELEENLVQQGKLQEEIDIRVEESIETTKFEEKLEKIIEKEQESIVIKKLKKHDLEINEQNSNENIDNEENLEVLKPELDAIESESEANKDFLEESTKIVSEESDEEETEHLQELYRQETGRRPIYARQKTKGYSQWLEQRELRSEKIKISKSEIEKKKEIEEEGWKTTLKQWIKEASEEECNAELKSELKKALESYNEFKDLTRKFLELYEKSQYEKLTEIEKNRLKSLTERLQELGPIQLELLANIRAFKNYFYNHLWELLNRFFVNRARSKFLSKISQKYKILERELNFKKENKEIRNGEQKRVRHPSLKKGIMESDHYNKWLTENIQKYLKNLNPKTRLLFEPFIEFKNMGALFGLYKNYIPTNRTFKNYKKIIARSILDEMRVNFKKVIENWLNKYPHLIHSLLLIKTDIIKFIDEYEAILQPKPTPNYQMFNHHPNFKRDYFKIIDTNEKAYWLGFLFADGYITIEHKKKRLLSYGASVVIQR